MDNASNPPALVTALASGDIKAAICIAIGISLFIALIEIPSKAKTTRLRACLVGPSFFYWVVLSFGNTVTTLLASVAVVKMPASLSDYYFLLSAFFGVFAFETVLKNTNITMFDKGVLTIQNWIDKALDAAAAAAIDRQETIKQEEETKLVDKLRMKTEVEINTRVLNKLGTGKVETLDKAAQASGADRKLYKIYQLLTALTTNERAALLKESDAPSVGMPPVQNLTNNDVRVLLAMEDGGCRLPDQIQDRAAGFGYEKHPQAEPIQHRIERFISLGFVERVGGSEYCITPDGRRVLNDIRQNPGSHYEAIRESRTQNAKAGSSSQIIQAGRDVSLIKRDR